MTILKTLLVASLFLTGNTTDAATAGNGEATATAATTTTTTTTVAEEASLDELTSSIRGMVKYPRFAVTTNQQPIQEEIIVRISFRVGEENSLDIMEVHGNNDKVNKYVMENLDGRILEQTPLLPGVMFHTTLRFVM